MEIRKNWLSFVVRGFLALLATFATHLLRLDYIESWFFDQRQVFHKAPPLSDHIAIVNTRPSTKERLGRFPSFQQYADLLQQIKNAQPKAVVFVSDINDISGDFVEQTAFAQAAAKFALFYVSAEHAQFSGGLEILPMRPPFNDIQTIPGSRTSDTDKFAKDGVSRRIVVSFQNVVYLHTQLAQLYNPEIKDLKKIGGQFDVFGSDQVYIDYHPIGSFPTYSFEDVLEAKINPDSFKDKVVFVGTDTEFDNKDYALTPYSREKAVMPLSELHANMLETLIQNSAPQPVPRWINIFVTFLISLLILEVILNLRPVLGILVLAGTFLFYLALGFILMRPFGLMIGMAHPMIAIFICYYFFIPYRLIVENRRSWEYFQKHKLLSEVEQLKTNFIGMMSHDLKTPLARIQGMTDIINRGPQLQTEQQEAVELIRQSSEDLTRFITTILNYAQIENQGVQLHLQSKDINELIRVVAKKNEFLAKIKHIQLNLELEPLFSIHVDPDLIQQVISNLIENAIKYSPDHSKVLITTEEEDGQVVIQVADQGVGIPPIDIDHVFMKFFRSPEAKNSPIKGSGLGLYLARYFVELHKGRIIVESTPGQGSTFIVYLPVN